jgi:membrane protein
MPFGSGTAPQRTIAGGTRERGIPPKTEAAPGPDSPFDLAARDWKTVVKDTVREIREDRITLVAAGMAFYFFLAVFPALIAAVGVLGLLNASPVFLSSLTDSIQRSMPGGAGEILLGAIRAAQQGSKGASLFAAIFGIAVALWSATAGMMALQIGLDISYDIPKERPFFKARGVALLLVVATGVLGALPAPFFAAKGVVWSVIGWLVTLGSITTLFAIYYYLGPKREKPSWTWITPGGVLGGLIWILSSLGFSLYVSNFAKYGETYGPLAGVVILIFWLYLSALAIVVGGELNAQLERRAAEKDRPALANRL